MTRPRSWPIPSKVELGFHVVHVKLLTKGQMRDEMDDDDPKAGADEVIEGFWDVENDMIAIGKWLPKRKQRWVLLHEMGHACLDLRDRYDKEP